ncbi:MAG: hypothetical protein BWY51_00590 [Parcubacteria group bacterium ADurb.Bin316]|nr:MAG: hypothetical protein BWY51_00590 [Parcubacteria group bacterium ADurb.Bin316]
MGTSSNDKIFNEILVNLVNTVINIIENKWLLILLLAIFCLLVWLLIREINTWYWKINDILVVLKKIEKNTRQNNNVDVEGKQPEIKAKELVQNKVD